MTATLSTPRSGALIRNEPVQARSTARLTALLDAAARVIDRIGYERLTTAMVAEGAGASIGTVYRYFPDRIAVLQSLAARNVERVGEAALTAAGTAADSEAAIDAVIDRLVEAFRAEPGFASLRFGDTIDLRPQEGPAADDVFADRLHAVLSDRFGVADGDEAARRIRASVATAEALIARAFGGQHVPDEAFLAVARSAARDIAGPVLD